LGLCVNGCNEDVFYTQYPFSFLISVSTYKLDRRQPFFEWDGRVTRRGCGLCLRQSGLREQGEKWNSFVHNQLGIMVVALTFHYVMRW
jgi:hypothetical protein